MREKKILSQFEEVRSSMDLFLEWNYYHNENVHILNLSREEDALKIEIKNNLCTSFRLNDKKNQENVTIIDFVGISFFSSANDSS